MVDSKRSFNIYIPEIYITLDDYKKYTALAIQLYIIIYIFL